MMFFLLVLTVGFIYEWMKRPKSCKKDIDKFASLGGATLASLLDRSSKVILKHPEKCQFFSLFGTILGYELWF